MQVLRVVTEYFFFFFIFFPSVIFAFSPPTSFAELYCCCDETTNIPSRYSIVSVLQYMWLLDVREDRGGFEGYVGGV